MAGVKTFNHGLLGTTFSKETVDIPSGKLKIGLGAGISLDITKGNKQNFRDSALKHDEKNKINKGGKGKMYIFNAKN